MDIIFNKLYKNDRTVNSSVCIPFKMGTRKEEEKIYVFQNGVMMPTQEKITSKYKDGSVRFSFLRFQCNLPANKGAVVECKGLSSSVSCGCDSKCFKAPFEEENKNLSLTETENGFVLANKYLSVTLANNTTSLFDKVVFAGRVYDNTQFVGPILKTADDNLHNIEIDEWKVMEAGPVLNRLKCKGKLTGSDFTFECNVSLGLDSKSVDVSFRIINSSEQEEHLKALWFSIMAETPECKDISSLSAKLDFSNVKNAESHDSTGCGDKAGTEKSDDIINTTGTLKLKDIESEIDLDKGVRTVVGKSNYKTNFTIGKNGTSVQYLVDADYLIGEANEHFAEVFYGTFFADRTDKCGGVAATIYKAQQNFPKAVKADNDGIYVMIIPEGSEKIVMSGGMSREQSFSLLFHEASMPLEEIDDISLRYQLPDKPWIDPKVFKDAGVFPEIYTDEHNWNEDVEMSLIAKCDSHGRAYGMLNFGDAPDPNYTTQGRGNGMLVWSNNEYDYPHACAMQYSRTGERRFMDYAITSALHWMDVDVCHFSNDPLLLNGQWEHTARHNKNGVMVCSHEWVEGLLDYYHFTGDERGLETAVGIGENVLRLLDTPMYQKPGEANARETGWALRSLTALYVETGDMKWVEKCDWIVEQFVTWKDNYGEWIAPYTDNTLIRTGFMISVAIGSLMRYYRVFPSDELKDLILSAIDDLVENASLPYGIFYYKELPSLNRLGNNTLLLEAMAIGYELTGETSYLKAGLKTFEREIKNSVEGYGGAKRHVEDAVLVGNTSPKAFAQQFLPLTTFYVALLKENIMP